MGLTHTSTGRGAVDDPFTIGRRRPGDRIIALAGNPNVGKSTLFNALTGLDQHTGNWPGKTVATAQGACSWRGRDYILVDLPGTYSLLARSAEEEVARDFLCFGPADAVVVVCDATNLERNLNLVLQIMELTGRVVVCVNLMDEARRKGIRLDLPLLARRLGVPVVGVTARKKRTLEALLAAVEQVCSAPPAPCARLHYPTRLEQAVDALEPLLREQCGASVASRWLAARLLEGDDALLREASAALGWDLASDEALAPAAARQREELLRWGIDGERIRDLTASTLVTASSRLCLEVVKGAGQGYSPLDRKLDRLLTGRWTGWPILLLSLAFILWLTILGANVPSQLLSAALFSLQNLLSGLFLSLGAPAWLRGLLVDGVYRTLAWVVSVMLPPMAIFFPLFTLLEDAGFLPRVAYDLDRPFQLCGACGKQALTMCMGFGCNAAGVTGCRIIDSPRERLLAILTNSFVPCNGRFPILIALITMFFAGTGGSIGAACLLTGVILLAVGLTLAATKLLSVTVLKGVPSSFTLEMPPYRRPQIGQVLVRSVFDRTLFVLGRAAAVAAPAGALIWILANVSVGELTLLGHLISLLDPIGRVMGLDGAILCAFLLAFPANELAIPLLLMAYLSQGSLTEAADLTALHSLLTAQGWTWATAVSAILFSLLHWPCSTTLLTVWKETGSGRWTALALLLPTAAGCVLCILFTCIVRILGL